MHHYGEAAVKVDLSDTTFNIILHNHITGAEITISGPRKGIYETKDRELGPMDAEKLGQELAHFIRTILI